MRLLPCLFCPLCLYLSHLSGVPARQKTKLRAGVPNRINSETRDEMNSGAYDKAVPLLEARRPCGGRPLAQQAQLDKSLRTVQRRRKAQAIATLDRSA